MHGNKGKIHSKEIREKMSKGQKGKHLSKETKKKMSESNKGKIPWNKGITWKKRKKSKPFSKEHKRKLSEAKKGKKRGYPSEETRKKISEALKGRKVSEETKRKIRESTFNYVKRVRNILYPCIGHNEKQILDKIEKEIGYKIIRQYKVEGYFLDGYIEELNIAIEVDERPKIKEKEIERQKIIEKKLNCKFLRINDFD